MLIYIIFITVLPKVQHRVPTMNTAAMMMHYEAGLICVLQVRRQDLY